MFDTLIERLKLWARIQAGIERLRQLDDQQLGDMGIESELIPQIVRSGVIVTHATLADEAERRVAARDRSHYPANGGIGSATTSRCPSVPA